jgi:hypothetical protein
MHKFSFGGECIYVYCVYNVYIYIYIMYMYITDAMNERDLRMGEWNNNNRRQWNMKVGRRCQTF